MVIVTLDDPVETTVVLLLVVVGTVLVSVDVLVPPVAEVVVVVAVAVALKAAHAALPALWARPRSPCAVQEARRQGTTRLTMALWVGPHWHPTSPAGQPAALMAEERQAVAQAGWPERS